MQRTVIAGQAVDRALRREHAGLLAALPLLGHRLARMPSTPTRRWSEPSSGSAACPARSWSTIRSARCSPIGAAARSRFNPRFLDLAGHYGFRPRACRPARAQTKGKDERNVGYVKHHFFVRYRAFDSWAHLNQLAEQWLREEADPRVHGTVHEVVAERFAREAPTLQPLPPRRYDTSYWEPRQVGWDAYVEVRGNRYSVPAGLGRPGRSGFGSPWTARVASTTASSASLSTCCSRGARAGSTVPDHHAALWADTLAVERRPLAVYEEVATWN